MTDDFENKIKEEKQVPNVVIPDYLQNLLTTIASREGFADGYKFVSRPWSNVGDGFIGLMLSVVIYGSRNGNADDELVLVCKIPPFNESRQKFAANPFKQEIRAYEKWLPALVEFQKEKGVSASDGFFAFPKCYGSYADDVKSEYAIVMEDLRHFEYRMWNKYSPIDYQHVKLAISQLGRLHALSFAIRQQRPTLFAEIATLDSAMFRALTGFPNYETFHQTSYNKALEALHPGDTDEIVKITHLRDNFMDKFRSLVSPSDPEPFTVFCHGDFWNNNIMFQYSSADSMEPQRVCIIDWQICQYCSPATDLSYYLYTSIEQPLRTAHFDDIINDYYGNLSDLLKQLGGNPDSQFSKDDLHGQLNTFGIYGLLLAPTLIQLVMAKAEDIPDRNNTNVGECTEGFLGKNSPAGFNVRMRDVIRDFVSRGCFSDKQDYGLEQ